MLFTKKMTLSKLRRLSEYGDVMKYTRGVENELKTENKMNARVQTVYGMLLLLLSIVVGVLLGQEPGYCYRVIAVAAWILAAIIGILLAISVAQEFLRKSVEAANDKEVLLNLRPV